MNTGKQFPNRFDPATAVLVGDEGSSKRLKDNEDLMRRLMARRQNMSQVSEVPKVEMAPENPTLESVLSKDPAEPADATTPDSFAANEKEKLADTGAANDYSPGPDGVDVPAAKYDPDVQDIRLTKKLPGASEDLSPVKAADRSEAMNFNGDTPEDPLLASLDKQKSAAPQVSTPQAAANALPVVDQALLHDIGNIVNGGNNQIPDTAQIPEVDPALAASPSPVASYGEVPRWKPTSSTPRELTDDDITALLGKKPGRLSNAMFMLTGGLAGENRLAYNATANQFRRSQFDSVNKDEGDNNRLMAMLERTDRSVGGKQGVADTQVAGRLGVAGINMDSNLQGRTISGDASVRGHEARANGQVRAAGVLADARNYSTDANERIASRRDALTRYGIDTRSLNSQAAIDGAFDRVMVQIHSNEGIADMRDGTVRRGQDMGQENVQTRVDASILNNQANNATRARGQDISKEVMTSRMNAIGTRAQTMEQKNAVALRAGFTDWDEMQLFANAANHGIMEAKQRMSKAFSALGVPSAAPGGNAPSAGVLPGGGANNLTPQQQQVLKNLVQRYGPK